VRNLLLSIRRTRSNIVVYNNSVSIDALFLVLYILIFRYSFFMEDRELIIIWYLNKEHAAHLAGSSSALLLGGAALLAGLVL